MTWAPDPGEVSFTAIRAQGAGGQNVNKVSNAVHLRFDLRAAHSLPEPVRERLLALADHRITRDGVVVIKAQDHRSLEMNRADALARLRELVRSVWTVAPPRKPTKATWSSKQKRLAGKSRRGEIKAGRGAVRDD